MPKQTIYNAGIYVRLSKDDERAGESLSIENQKRILTSYVTEQGWNIVDIYVDDGYSGTNFDRPGVTRLLEDANAADEYGNIRAALEKAGTPIGPLDMMIAGHARSLSYTVVTNNVREFERVSGLRIENWAEELQLC